MRSDFGRSTALRCNQKMGQGKICKQYFIKNMAIIYETVRVAFANCRPVRVYVYFKEQLHPHYAYESVHMLPIQN